MVRATSLTSWERKTAQAHIRVVPSAALNTRRAFERHANQHAKAHTRPTCAYTQAHLNISQQGGPVSLVQGHYALLPLTITHGKPIIRATDPLPCSGSRSHQQAIQSLRQLAATLKVQDRFSKSKSKALPESDWDHLPTLRQHVQNVAEQLSTIAYIRVADKSSLEFCRQWVWDETHRFLEGEGYKSQAIHTSPSIMQALRHIIQQNKWPVNSSRTLPLLHLLGKAKSLIKQCILWRPITGVVEPQIQRFCFARQHALSPYC